MPIFNNQVAIPCMSRTSTRIPSLARKKPEHAPPIKEQIKHKLPPRPQSPLRKNPDIKHPASEPKQQKRPLESADPTPPEKRAKIGHSRTPSNSSLKTLSRNPATPSWLGGCSIISQAEYSWLFSLAQKANSNQADRDQQSFQTVF